MALPSGTPQHSSTACTLKPLAACASTHLRWRRYHAHWRQGASRREAHGPRPQIEMPQSLEAAASGHDTATTTAAAAATDCTEEPNVAFVDANGAGICTMDIHRLASDEAQDIPAFVLALVPSPCRRAGPRHLVLTALVMSVASLRSDTHAWHMAAAVLPQWSILPSSPSILPYARIRQFHFLCKIRLFLVSKGSPLAYSVPSTKMACMCQYCFPFDFFKNIAATRRRCACACKARLYRFE